MRYKTYSVFIVKYSDGRIAHVFGNERDAEAMVNKWNADCREQHMYVDEWPCEFAFTKEGEIVQ